MADTPFKDAEAWLAEQGVERNPLRVPLEPPAVPDAAEPSGPAEEGRAEDTHPAEPDHGHSARGEGPPVSARDAARLAQASAEETLRRADEAAAARPQDAPRLEDDVAEAVAFVRRSTANAPQAEGRLAGKLSERGYPTSVVEQAMQQCRRSGLVDDQAMARALVDEGRRKGHAPLRLRTDLKRRGLSSAAIDAAMAEIADQDPEAVAFALARAKADTLSGVAAETAYRRVVAHLARRGHPEGLARKVAREAVFTAREDERTAGH